MNTTLMKLPYENLMRLLCVLYTDWKWAIVRNHFLSLVLVWDLICGTFREPLIENVGEAESFMKFKLTKRLGTKYYVIFVSYQNLRNHRSFANLTGA